MNLGNEKVCLVNLGNYMAKTFTITCEKDLRDAIMSVNPNGENDIDVEYLSGCLTGRARLDFIFIVEMAVRFNLALDVVGKIYNAADCAEEVEKILENETYLFVEAGNRELAYREYLEMTGELDGIPPYIVDYIDFGQWYEDSDVTISASKHADDESNSEYVVLY